MAKLTFAVYEFHNGEVKTLDNHVVDTADTDAMKDVRNWNKKATMIVVPVLPDADVVPVDLDGVEALTKPGRRQTSDWTDEMVKTAHEVYADQDVSMTRVAMELYKQHDAEVTEQAVRKTLNQEINTHTKLEDGLRERAKAKVPAKGIGRKKYSDEFKDKVVKFMEQGHSGVQAEAEFGVHNSQCNSWYRKQHGYRRNDKVAVKQDD